MPAGIGALRRALPGLLETPDLPGWAREVFTDLAHRLRTVDERIAVYDRRGEAVARQTEPAQRLLQAPGIGPVTATALVATVGNAHAFTNGRQVAALHARRGFNKAVVALAATHARIVWALLATGRTYQPPAACL